MRPSRGGCPNLSGSATEGGRCTGISPAHGLLRSKNLVENALPDDPTPPTLNTTALDTLHRALGARMVPFAGYAMPVRYDLPPPFAERCPGGIIAEHLHCRVKA